MGQELPCGKFRVWTRSAPERDHGGQGESGGVVAGQLVVAGSDPAEVLETAESGLDAPAFLIAALVVAQRALAGAGAGDDGVMPFSRRSARSQSAS